MGRSVVNTFFYFKQKTAYEMRMSDWSSDVCSSDLLFFKKRQNLCNVGQSVLYRYDMHISVSSQRYRKSKLFCVGFEGEMSDREASIDRRGNLQIGRASCRERVCQYV